jgi:lysophospholipase L1-like esterase
MARLWQAGGLEVSPHPPARRNAEDDGIFGLGGTRVTMKDPSAFVSLKLAFEGAADSTVGYELYYRATNETDRLLLSVGTERREFGQGDATTTVGGLSVTRFDSSGKQAIEIRALRGKPQLFGIVAESKRPGLVIDTLGINGARFGTFLAWERESFQSLVAQRSPLIAVVAYGTNEVYDGEPIARHAARLEQVIERLRAAVPDIGCIVAGPTDAGKGGEAATSRVVALDQAERSTAERIGCAYFSPFDVMSADGGFQSWRDREPPLALSDGIHLTAHGYNRLGEEMAKRCLTVDGK